MESLAYVFKIIQLNCWMISADLKDTLYSIPSNTDHQKYFKFYWNQFFNYIDMPNDYSKAMCIFTKIATKTFICEAEISRPFLWKIC